jgi:parvulin-like peptidyl-prolyl isomerase
LAAVLALSGGRAAAEVVDEIVAKVNEDIVTKSDLESEEQAAVQDLYRQYSGTDLDTRVAQAKSELLRHLIDRRVLVQRAGHLFDMSKMQEYFLTAFKENQNIKSDKELERLLAQQNMTMADLKTRLLDDAAPQQVIRAEIVERIAVSEKEERDYYDAHLKEFLIPGESTVREIVIKATAADRDAKRTEAEAARARAAAPGADFAAIAAEVSDAGTKKQGGLLGTVKRGDLSEALDDAAFTVAVGEVSPVLEADYGFHIVKVDSRIEPGVKPFDAVKDEVETKIRSERFSAEYKTYMKKAWTEATIWISPKYENRLSSDEVAN